MNSHTQSKQRIRRAFVTVGDRQVHFRYAGSGPAVILIGQSPTAARTLDRQTRAFAEHFTAIALDAPGLGRSTALNTSKPDVADQAIALAEVLDEMEIEKVGLYGSHTGASICLEFARRFPERSAITLLDGLPIYSDLERNLRLSTYFPEYTATWEGLHLMWLWYRYREQNVFWPWNIRGKGTRGDVDIPSPEKLHDGLVDILEVGMGYVPPYAAVFRYRAEEAIPHVTTPVCFLAYPDDSLLPALKHLPNLPDCCRIEEMPIDKDAGVEREVSLLRAAGDWGRAPPVIRTQSRARDKSRDYLDLPGGQLALRRYGEKKGRPIIVLPPAPGSVSLLGTLPQLMSRDREVIAIDLPGCGDSDVLEDVVIEVEAYAKTVAAALSALTHVPVDIYAKNGGAVIAAALLKYAPALVNKAVLDDPPALPPRQRDEIAARYAEPIRLDWDGAHLVRLWHATRDQELYWPWYERTRNAVRQNDPDIDPERLTIEVHSYLKNYESYADTWKAVLSYPLHELIENGDDRLIVCGDENGKFVEFARSAAGTAFHALPIGYLARSAAILDLLAE